MWIFSELKKLKGVIMTILGACEQILAQQKVTQEFVDKLSARVDRGFAEMEAALDVQQKQLQALDARLAAIEATLGTSDPVGFVMTLE
jgi:hypothetical protein